MISKVTLDPMKPDHDELLNKMLKDYWDKMTLIHWHQQYAKDLADKQRQKINNYQDWFSSHTMAFRSAEDAENIFFGNKELSLEELSLALYLYQNKQYQWLLVEAYEEFEDCLKRLYVYAGYFEEQAKKKGVNSIIEKFGNTYPSIKKLESNNKLQVNLRLAINLVAQLRHIIVHKAGVVSDKEEFKKKTIEACGLWNNGNYPKEYTEFIEQYFWRREYENIVWLLERTTNRELGAYKSVFRILSGYLMAYIDIIIKQLKLSQDKLSQS